MSFVVYSKSDCHQCDAAKRLLVNARQPFDDRRLGRDFTRAEFIGAFPFVKQFPLVTLDGMIVGGLSDLFSLLASNYHHDERTE